jgi:hypothetical protein
MAIDMAWLNRRLASAPSLRPVAWAMSAMAPTPMSCVAPTTRKNAVPAAPTPATALSPSRETK